MAEEYLYIAFSMASIIYKNFRCTEKLTYLSSKCAEKNTMLT